MATVTDKYTVAIHKNGHTIFDCRRLSGANGYQVEDIVITDAGVHQVGRDHRLWYVCKLCEVSQFPGTLGVDVVEMLEGLADVAAEAAITRDQYQTQRDASIYRGY